MANIVFNLWQGQSAGKSRQINQINENLTFSGGTPGFTNFRQLDWPNPLRAVAAISLLTLATFQVPVNQMPVGQTFDRPNPVLRPTTPVNITHINQTPLNLLGKDKFTAGRQLDWPNPRTLLAPNEVYAWHINSKNQFTPADPIIYFISGTTWPVDPTWNTTSNKLEGIGPGGNGAIFATVGGGGGGGAYAVANNVTSSHVQPNDSLTIAIPAGGSQLDTTIADRLSANILTAKAGANAVTTAPGAGGAAGSCVPSAGAFSGGAGNAGAAGRGGAGGAAGPLGAGNSGVFGSSFGGSGDAGGGGAGGIAIGANGADGANFDATHGSGGGGAGGAAGSTNGGNGGKYGGAGGGGGLAAGTGAGGLLVITWTATTAPQAFPNLDWPNPRGAQRSIDSYGWINTSAQVLKLPALPPPSQYDWPNPTRTPFRLQDWSFVQQQPVTGLPVGYQRDWPNPTAPRRSIDLWTWVQSRELGVQPPIQNFNRDWPNPRGPTFPIDLRTHIDTLKLNLRSKDNVIPGVPLTDQPNPRAPTPRVPPGHIDYLSFLLTPSISNVFIPNPPTRPWVQSNFVNNSAGFAPATIKPPSQLDWPNPRGAQQPITNYGFTQSSAQALTITQKPPVTYDYPNPRGAFQTITNYTWTQGLLPDLNGKDTFFGLAGHPNFDWPNPIPSRRSVDLLTIGENSQILNQIVQLFPIVTTFDWPNPRRPQYPTQDWINTFPLSLRGADLFTTGRLLDWPNPVIAKPVSIDLGTWLQSINVIVPPPPATFNHDWTNPRLNTPTVVNLGFTLALNLELRGKDTTFGLGGYPNFDWPNPKGPRQPITNYQLFPQYPISFIPPPPVGPVSIHYRHTIGAGSMGLMGGFHDV